MTIQFYQHPEYQRLAPHWTRYRDFYEGDHDTLASNTNYLIPHYIELKKDESSSALRRAREQRTRFLAVPEIIVSLWTSIFFSEAIELSEQDKKILGEGVDNVDGKKTSFNDYLKDNVLVDLLVYGKPITLVDAHKAEFKSLGEQNIAGFRPFVEQINPLSLVDWELETESTARYGRYNFARYEYLYLPKRASASEEPKQEQRSTVLSLKDKKYTIQIYKRTAKEDKKLTALALNDSNSHWEPVGETISTLDEIPLITIHDESWIKDVVEEMLRHFNIRSAKDNTLATQGYQRLWVKGITNDEQMKAFSANIVWRLPAEGEMGAIEPVSTESFERAEAEAINNAFKVGLNMLRQLPSDSRLTQAEGTQAEEKKNTYSLVESTLTQLENYGREIINQWAKFSGNKNHKSDLTLNKEIDDEDINQFVTLYQAFRDDFMRAPEAHKEIVKKAFSKMNLDDDILEKANLAIDNAPTTTELDKQQSALDSILGQ